MEEDVKKAKDKEAWHRWYERNKEKAGTLLVGKTNDEIKELLEQSKINLNYEEF